MPNDEIHGTSMVYWKSAVSLLKCATRCSEKTKVRSAITSAKLRIERTWSRPKNKISRAPIVGVKVMIVRMCALMKSITQLSQEPGHDQNSAKQNPADIRSYISALHVTQPAAGDAH